MFNVLNSGVSGTGAFSLFSPIHFKNEFQKGICPFPHGIFKKVLKVGDKKKRILPTEMVHKIHDPS